jgi:cytidylate kinase
MLARGLGYKFYSMGDMRGKMAMERGLTIDQLNKLGEKEAWTDKDVDEYQKELGRKEDNFVIDSWLGWHFIPHSLKVLLQVKPDIAAERIFKHQRPDEDKKATVAALEDMLDKRVIETRGRYKKYYGIGDPFNPRHYDLVIDTNDIPAEKVAEKILEAAQKKV